VSNDTFVALTLFLLLMAGGHWLLRLTSAHRATLRFQGRVYFIAMVLRFAASLALYQFGFWVLLGDADAAGWGYGATLANQWTASGANGFDVLAAWSDAFRFTGAAGGALGQSSHLGYYYLLGTVFYVTGESSRLISAAINCFFGALIVVFAYRTARTLFSEWVAVRVAWWTCLFPSMIIWSAQTVKEPIVILHEVVALYCCLRLKKSGYALRYVLLAAFAVALVFPFRFYAAYIGMAAIAVVLAMPGGTPRNATRWSVFSLATFIVAIAGIALILANSQTRIDKFDLDFVQQFRHDIAQGTGSGVELDVDMRTTAGFSVGTLVGAAHLLLAPFPWQLGSGTLRMLLTTPELVYWWWLFFIGIVPGARFALRYRTGDLLPVLVFILGLGLLYSMTFGNVGLIFRQRAQLLPWLLMFAGVGLEQRMVRIATRMRAYSFTRVVPAVSRS
jgi:4-amino-4-deoxy-L-arabinose transferase-like glycosyltransferase